MTNATHKWFQTTQHTPLGIGFARAYCQYIAQRGTPKQIDRLIKQIGEDGCRKYCEERGLLPKMLT